VEDLEKRELLATTLAAPLHFDFGTSTSAVATGYTGVSLSTYADTLGYGWQSLSGLSAVDRHTSNSLTTDFVRGTDGKFLVNLPNGTYAVTPTLGDVKGSLSSVSVYAQGQRVGHGLSTNYGQLTIPTYTVQLTNGQLQLEFKVQAGDGGYFALDALDIVLPTGSPPSANAGPSQTVNEGSAVTFAGSASGSSNLTYLWNFGDGATASGTLTPTHTYAGNGSFTVTLTVTDANSQTAQASTSVTVNNVAPTGNPGGPYAADAGSAITLTGTATDPGAADTAAGFTYAWDFGDGTTASAASPSHTYAAVGTYTVSLTTTDASGGSSTATTTATVGAAPTANAGSSQTVNEGSAVTFAGSATGSSALSYLWNFGDGGTASGTLTPTYTYAGNGTFTVTLTVTDALSVSVQSSTTVTVNNLPPTGNPGGPYTGDNGAPISFAATATDPGAADTAAGFTYAWDFGDGSTASGANPSHSYATVGTYTVTLTTTDASGGSSSATTTATANAAPTAGAGASQTVNEGSAVTFAGSATGSSALTYLWNFGDGTTASGTLTPTYTYAGNGTFTATLTVTDAVGVSAQSTTSVTVNNLPPTGNPGGPYTGDNGAPIAFAATATDPGAADTAAGFTFAWDFGDGTTASGANPSHAYAAVGTYIVALTTTDASGGSSAATTTATVNAAPTANAGSNQTVNEGSAVTFAGSATGSSTLTYLWNFGDGGTASGTLSPTYTYAAAKGTFTVTLTVTDALGVSAQSTANVTISNLPPTGSIGGPYSGHTGSPISFTGTATDPGAADTAAGFTYTWNFGDGTSASGASHSHSYTAVGTYTVTMTVADAEGASSSSTTTATVVSSVYPPTTGIFDVGYVNGSIPSGILTNANVDGYSARATWSFIEPSQGVYNWSNLDSVISAAAAAGKKVTLSVAAGIKTPSWVYAAGAKSFSYIDDTSPNTQSIPVPWDSVFLAQWKSLIQQLGNRYAGNSALTQVKITGIATDTAETQLPNSTGATVTQSGKTWTTTNDPVNWQAIGYTRLRVENAWQTIADAWAQAFPKQQISTILVPNNFPPIDNNGNIYSNAQHADNQILNDFINLGMARYGSQFAVQNNGLNDAWIFTQASSQADQVPTGYQTLWWVTGDSTYKMNNGTPIAITTELQTALNTAIADHARFLEIYPEDITNSTLQSVLASTHAGLVSNDRPLGMITGLPTAAVLEGTNTFMLGSALVDPTTTSASGFSYAWTVTHNGTTVATGSNAAFSFTATDSGSYVVSLQVIDPSGNASWVNSRTISITNLPPTITSLSVPSTGTKGSGIKMSVTATDPGPADVTAGLLYTWLFGDGTSTTGTSAPTHTYKYAGTYTVTVTVTDQYGAKTTSKATITIS
jgi:PKD repeat protein